MTETPPSTIVRFIAPGVHPNDPTTVYGPGHEMVIADPDVVIQLGNRGVIEVVPEGSLDPQEATAAKKKTL